MTLLVMDSGRELVRHVGSGGLRVTAWVGGVVRPWWVGFYGWGGLCLTARVVVALRPGWFRLYSPSGLAFTARAG